MVLEMKGLSKQYGSIYALKDFTTTLTEGVYGILGPNGAGKSTLMNLLTDNVKRDKGEILYDGQDILKMGGEFRKLLGYMPQQQGLYDHFSARKFLFYMAALKGLSRKQARKEIEFLLELVGLNKEAHRKLGGFSGGMRQRVLLATALLGDPKILILDEPTAGLDPEERIRIRNFISEIAQNKIVLLATHVVSDIECIAAKVLLIKKGQLMKEATPYELIESIEGKVAEAVCTLEEIKSYQESYHIGNVSQRKEGLVLRLVGDDLPEAFRPVKGNIDMEDVYLYYLEGRA
ncbi:MAG: type transport system ATP-binding protein [Herbinix sp.]|jgi:ABC-type multidrug transport system ATPase subunit|nr:type transport system ATP-binding protein [Herbinix sp.]